MHTFITHSLFAASFITLNAFGMDIDRKRKLLEETEPRSVLLENCPPTWKTKNKEIQELLWDEKEKKVQQLLLTRIPLGAFFTDAIKEGSAIDDTEDFLVI